MLDELKKQVYEANMELFNKNLILYSWGNVSGIDRERNLVVIKPSGVPYESMRVQDMVVVNLAGEVIEGDLKPSSDTPTHIELYKNFPKINGVTHTHSKYATVFAQAGLDIPALGTTHADYFYGNIPCTRLMMEAEVLGDYEKNTGKVIVETFECIDPESMPGVLVNGHGPFTWGTTPKEAVMNSVILDNIAEMAYRTLQLSNSHQQLDTYILDKHYFRKHGKNAYYGQ